MPAEEAIVLVGGLGTRLRPVVGAVPKPMAPVAGRPFLAWLLDRLAASGLRRVILATGYRSDDIEQVVGRRWDQLQIDYSIEATPLGTGGAVRAAASSLAGDGVHVVNGDTWLRYAPNALEAATREQGTHFGMALAKVDDAGRYGAVDVRDGRVVGFREKSATGAGWINAGCYFLSSNALDALPGRDCFSLEADVLAPLAAIGAIAAFQDTSGFIDIGVPADYARSQHMFAAQVP
jgi:D-glycero-alpha-D-manno-heptose 1-phosphate guanylyltransferase